MRTGIRDKIATLCAAAIIAVGVQTAWAQSSEFASAVQTFNGGQYPQAADMLVQYLRQQPNDALAHYYLAVTWHCLGRPQEAAKEYNWVLHNTPDPELLKRANMGLTVVSRSLATQQPAVAQAYAAPSAQQQYAPQQTPPQAYPAQQYPAQQYAPEQYPAQQRSPEQPPYQGTTGWLSGQGAQQAAAATGATLPANIATQGRIIDLYTQWCGWCKRFEPIFVQAQAKYGSALQFERIDAEARGNDRLVKKYKVRGYPTVLLLDNNGNLRKRIDGAPQSLQEFETTIFAAYPALRSY